MKRFLLLSVVVLSASYAFSQSAPNVHRDQVYAFEVKVPTWWTIRETPTNLFGGTFPAINSVENALIFKSFTKDKFKDLLDFESWVIRSYKVGDSPKWGPETMLLDVKESPEFKKLGNAWTVHLLNGNSMYDCCFIVTQTTTSFIWIDFTSTASTYPENFGKFKEIVNSFKAL